MPTTYILSLKQARVDITKVILRSYSNISSPNLLVEDPNNKGLRPIAYTTTIINNNY